MHLPTTQCVAVLVVSCVDIAVVWPGGAGRLAGAASPAYISILQSCVVPFNPVVGLLSCVLVVSVC